MAEGYFSLLGLKGTDEDFSLTLPFLSTTPSPTSRRGEKWDLNEDRPEGGPAGPKSPGRGDCFSSRTGWPGGKGYGRRRGRRCSDFIFYSWLGPVCPTGSAFSARSPGHTATCLGLQQAPCSWHLGRLRRRDSPRPPRQRPLSPCSSPEWLSHFAGRDCLGIMSSLSPQRSWFWRSWQLL